jgi:hypothetical protein
MIRPLVSQSFTFSSPYLSAALSRTCAIMHIKHRIALLVLYALFPAANAYSRRRCAFGDDCWPNDSSWQSFNDSVSGHLIRSVPSAAVCHQERYDAALCDAAKQEWENSFWRTNQTGAYSAILWELGNDQCFINSAPRAPCGPGLGNSILSWVR